MRVTRERGMSAILRLRFGRGRLPAPDGREDAREGTVEQPGHAGAHRHHDTQHERDLRDEREAGQPQLEAVPPRCRPIHAPTLVGTRSVDAGGRVPGSCGDGTHV